MEGMLRLLPRDATDEETQRIFYASAAEGAKWDKVHAWLDKAETTAEKLLEAIRGRAPTVLAERAIAESREACTVAAAILREYDGGVILQATTLGFAASEEIAKLLQEDTEADTQKAIGDKAIGELKADKTDLGGQLDKVNARPEKPESATATLKEDVSKLLAEVAEREKAMAAETEVRQKAPHVVWTAPSTGTPQKAPDRQDNAIWLPDDRGGFPTMRQPAPPLVSMDGPLVPSGHDLAQEGRVTTGKAGPSSPDDAGGAADSRRLTAMLPLEQAKQREATLLERQLREMPPAGLPPRIYVDKADFMVMEKDLSELGAMPKQGLANEIKSMKQEQDESTSKSGSATAALAQAEKDVAVKKKGLAEDEKYLRDLQQDCT